MTKIVKKTRFSEEPILEFGGEDTHLPDSEQGRSHHVPVRTCIVERARKEMPSLLRFVLSPEGEVVPDLKGNLPGRGVWVTAKRAGVSDAVKRRAFSRAFRKQVVAREDLPSHVEHLFKRSAIERLSIANKAGLVVVGFSKVDGAIRRRDLIALLHASDASLDGVSKLDRLFEALTGGKERIASKICFTSAEISLATGSSNVIHAGFKEGGASRAFLQALDRLNGYCTGDATPTPLCQGKE